MVIVNKNFVSQFSLLSAFTSRMTRYDDKNSLWFKTSLSPIKSIKTTALLSNLNFRANTVGVSKLPIWYRCVVKVAVEVLLPIIYSQQHQMVRSGPMGNKSLREDAFLLVLSNSAVSIRIRTVTKSCISDQKFVLKTRVLMEIVITFKPLNL